MTDLNKLYYPKNAGLKEIVEDAFKDIDPKEDGFDYTIGEIFGGKLKLVYEPNEGCFDSVCTDGVNGFGLLGVVEIEK